MKGKHIQLPYGDLSDDEPKKLLHFNVPPNYKRDILFKQFPYLSHVKNPMLNKIIKNGIVDGAELQKYLLLTGLLQDSIQQSLDMVVTDGFFNNAAVRRELDQKYPTLMKKPNPVNVIFKDKVHFDVQNPIVGLLAAQVRNNEKAIFEQVEKAPSTKEVTISERLEKLKKFNNKNNNDNNDNDDDDDDGNGDLPRLPTLPSFPPKNNEFDSEFDSDDKKLTPIQKFLLDKPQKEKLAVAVGENPTFAPQPQEKTTAKKVKFSDDLAKIFPEGNEIVKSNKIPNINEKDEISISNAQEMIAELNRGKLPDQLKFFEGDGREENLLLQKMRKNIGNLSKANLEFLEYLSSDYGKELLQKNKLKIHVESGEIFYDNTNTGKNFYNFFSDQEDETKNIVDLNLNSGGDLEYYVREILSGTTNDRFELHKNPTAKFLFHRFNNF